MSRLSPLLLCLLLSFVGFAWASEPAFATETIVYQGGGLYLVGEGGETTQIVDVGDSPDGFGVSPDGAHVVYSPFSGEHEGDVIIEDVGSKETHTISTPGETEMRWSEVRYAASGEQIIGRAYNQETETSGIYAIDIDGSNVRKLVAGGAWPVMSSQGALAYLSSEEGESDLYVVDPSPSGHSVPRKIASGGFYGNSSGRISFSPDGDFILFPREDEHVYSISVGSGAARLFPLLSGRSEWETAHTVLDADVALYRRNLETNVSNILASSPGAFWVRSNQPFGEAEPPAAFQPPSCESSSASTVVNESRWIQLSCTGPELEFEIDSAPSHGTVEEFSSSRGEFVYVPEPEFTGSDSVTFHAANGDGETEAKTVAIEVGAAECEEFDVGTRIEEPLNFNLWCFGPWIPPESEEEEGKAEPLTYEIVGGPSHGELSELNSSTGELTYTPDPEFEGSDQFTYRASDGHGAAAVKQVEVVVGEGPSCEGFTTQTEPGEPAALDLECDRAVGSSSYFELTSKPAHGSLHGFEAEDGTLVYRPETLFLGQDSFKFRAVNWAGESTEATATINVCSRPGLEVSGPLKEAEGAGVELDLYAAPGSPECEIGGHGPEIKRLKVFVDGSPAYSEERQCGSGESFCGRADMTRRVQLPYQLVIGSHEYKVEAEDQFGARSEPEEWTKDDPEEGTIVDPEAEDSKIKCKSEDPEEVRPYRSIDGVVIGTHCADLIPPIKGARTYEGLGGNDRILAGAGGNFIVGGEGDDTIFGGRGNDTIKGGKGSDYLEGGSGDDTIEGEEGENTLVGGAGRDLIRGGAENDLVKGGTTTDELNGGGGVNTLSFADGVTPGFKLYPGSGPLTNLPSWFPDKHGRRGVYVNLGTDPVIADNGETSRFGGGLDEITGHNFQNVIGTPFDDLIVGNGEANKIEAGPGTDVVRGGGGSDEIYGGADDDYLEGPGVLDGGSGADVCLSGSETPSCDSSNPEAELAQPSEGEIEVGLLGAGVPGAPADVYVIGSNKADELKASWSSGALTLTASGSGKGRFRVSGTETGCKVESSTEATCSVDVPQTLTLSGGTGGDTLSVDSKHPLPKDTSVALLGGEGVDHLIGGERTDDVLSDGLGSNKDVLSGRGGDDALFYAEGPDTLDGGQGNDLFISAAICDGDTIRGGQGSDNANWAQFTGPELQPENDEFPADTEEEPYGREAHGVKALLVKGTAVRQKKGCPSGQDRLFTLESLEGSHSADVLVGDEETNVLLGRAGRDSLFGKGGADSLFANNRVRKKDREHATEAERRDEDNRLNCGPGTDMLKMDPADKHHQEFCDGRVRIGGAEESEVREGLGPEGALDEELIGEASSAVLFGPVAFYRLDDTTGTAALNWADEGLEEDAEIAEEAEETEETELEKEEAEAESEEELEELAEEEPREEAEEEGPGAGEVHPGEYGGEPELGVAGALPESEAVRLDGVDDYIDLTNSWDPALFAPEGCETLGGYSVELWVKFGAEPGAREELFSRSEHGEGVFLYRGADGKIELSVVNATESPRVSSFEPVDDGEWHQVVATLADEEECIESRPFSLLGPEELDSTLAAPEITLTVDGFPSSLGLDHSPFPGETPNAHNIVGAQEGKAGFSNWLDGTVDDVAIYGEPLEQSEIQAHLAASDASSSGVFLKPGTDQADADEDGVPDSSDNCAETANPEQEDSNFDGIGDACESEPDSDEDGVADEVDNCPDEPNPLQEDENENGVGDACEAE